MADVTTTSEVISHEWDLIEDLPENWADLERTDLHAVHEQWVRDRALIKDESKVRKFQEDLANSWAIGTGIIERLYAVDRGVTIQILRAGMEALGQFHARGLISGDARALISDQRQAFEAVMELVGGRRTLTASYIKELHQRLTLSQETCEAEDQFGNIVNVPLLKGTWKTQPNNPKRPDGSIHQYCPPEFVQDEIDQLLAWHEEHERQEVSPEVEAAWLHHRFSQIHPFQDGNGRIARALTGAVFLKADYLVLVIRDLEHRERYLTALEAADRGDLQPLVDLFADVQIADLQDAMSSIRELRGETIVKVTETIAERARRRKEASQARVASVLDDILQIAHTRLDEAAAELRHAFKEESVIVSAQVFPDGDDKQDWWSWQIIEAARKHGYFAELDRPRRWVLLRLGLPEIERVEARFVISLHAIGRAADLHAVTAFLTNPLTSGEGTDSTRWQSKVIPDHPFRFGAETAKLGDIEGHFREWLETTIEDGLSVWGERL